MDVNRHLCDGCPVVQDGHVVELLVGVDVGLTRVAVVGDLVVHAIRHRRADEHLPVLEGLGEPDHVDIGGGDRHVVGLLGAVVEVVDNEGLGLGLIVLHGAPSVGYENEHSRHLSTGYQVVNAARFHPVLVLA